MNQTTPNHSLEELALSKLQEVPKDALEPFASELLKKVKSRSVAVVAYGSCLSQVTASSTSTPDFFVIVERCRDLHDSMLHRVLNCILPPSIYHFKVGDVIAKYNVIRLRDLQKHVKGVKDIYNLGRFSKRIGILWAEEAVFKQIAQAHVEAMRSVANYTLSLLPSQFSVDEFIMKALQISYIGDIRVEADNKTTKLFEAEKNYYRNMYALLLDELVGSGVLKKAGDHFQKDLSSTEQNLRMFRLKIFLKKSRLTSLLRWPKGIITVEHWIDYLLAKIERTKGLDLQITEHEKRYWFIYGWKYLWDLKRKNMLK